VLIQSLNAITPTILKIVDSNPKTVLDCHKNARESPRLDRGR
jgi:hypothetical protein